MHQYNPASPEAFGSEAWVGHLEALFCADTANEVWDMHCAAMAAFGFDRLLYGFTRFRNGTAMGRPEDYLILSNHSSDYLAGFIGGGMYQYGPMVRWAAENEGACSWRLIGDLVQRGDLSEREQAVLEFNRKHGVQAGYSISFRDQSLRSKGAVGLCARRGLDQDAVDAIWAEHGRAIQVLNTVLHLRISTMPLNLSPRALTPRQREVLEWVGEGKTSADIATILGVTVATVEKHLRLAREALGVETTAQALLSATFRNLIFGQRTKF